MPLIEVPSHPPTAFPSRARLRRIPKRRVARVFGALILATLVCLGMVFGWYLLGGNGPAFYYLVWNLVLAWVPLVCAVVAYRCYRRGRRRMLFGFCALAWFFFFPNAPYIVTDVIHVHDDNMSASWFQLLSIMAYAWTGLSLGYVSLYLMQEVVRAQYGRISEWTFVLVMLGAGTLGMYFGRFLRWNSWDVLRIPVGYLRHGRYVPPVYEVSGDSSFLVMMFCFLTLSYLILYSLTHLHEPVGDGP